MMPVTAPRAAGVLLAILAVLAVVVATLAPEPPSGRLNHARPPVTKLQKYEPRTRLNQEPGGAPVTLRGTQMYDACALLPETLVTSVGLTPAARLPTSAEYLSRDVDDPRFTGAVTTASKCGHAIEHPAGRDLPGILSVWVDQAPFNHAHLVRHKIETYQRQGSQLKRIGDVAWYEGLTPGSFTLFRPGATDTVFSFFVFRLAASYADKPRQQVIDELVAGLAATISAGPKGPAEYTYASPYDQIRDACDVLTPALFEEYTGEPDSGLVKETFSRGEMSDHFTGWVGQHVESTCTRKTVADVVRNSKGIRLEAKVRPYRNPRDAEFMAVRYCDPSSSATPIKVDHQVGAATCLVNELDQWLLFSVARYNVWLRADQPERTPPDQLIPKLIPIAEKIANGLR